jgi:uncharacterized damage-inducible protein DinB
MFRTVNDFLQSWQTEAENTQRLFGTLTDESLDYGNASFPRGVARLSQHIAESIPAMMGMIGSPIDEQIPFGIVPTSSDNVRTDYNRATAAVTSLISKWDDASLTEDVPFFGRKMPRGLAISVMIGHQTHHRGQLVVLMREAGLPSVAVYGPTREDWVKMGQEPHP